MLSDSQRVSSAVIRTEAEPRKCVGGQDDQSIKIALGLAAKKSA